MSRESDFRDSFLDQVLANRALADRMGSAWEECEQLRRAIRKAVGAAGNPDAAEGCRHVIAIGRRALGFETDVKQEPTADLARKIRILLNDAEAVIDGGHKSECSGCPECVVIGRLRSMSDLLGARLDGSSDE